MTLYKRGRVWHYEFELRGKRYRGSTRLKNERQAGDYERALRTKPVNSEVGIEAVEPAPALRDFAQQFIDHIEVRHADKSETRDFYAKKLRQLLRFDSLRDAALDRIDEPMIERFVLIRRRSVSAASVNRELATLRRMLQLAHEWKLIRSVPKVHMLTGERQRDFVLSHSEERRYLATAPEPLRSLAVLLLGTGLRLGEALRLQFSDVHLEPAGGARYGWLQVREGKSKNARRTVPLTARVAAMIKARRGHSPWLFPGESGERPMLGTTFAHLHIKVCRPGSGKKRRYLFPADFVIHSLRHTMLTRLGEAGADAFTIMRIAGHSSVTVSQRYVHPTPESVERAFYQLEALNRAAGKRLKVPTKSPHLVAISS